jgi:hypothetical protein
MPENMYIITEHVHENKGNSWRMAWPAAELECECASEKLMDGCLSHAHYFSGLLK